MLKTNKMIFMLAVGLFGAFACSNTGDKVTSGGLKYKLITAGDGETVADNHVLALNMSVKTVEGDSLILNNDIAQGPIAVLKVDSLLKKQDDGAEGVFRDLTKGDSVVFEVTAESFFVKTSRRTVPANLQSESLIRFCVGVSDVWTQEEFQEWQNQQMVKQQQEALKQQEEQLAMDIETIDLYLKEEGIEAEKDESGLRYVITTPGNGEKASAGQTVKVNYAGRVLHGKYFDTSLKTVAEEQGILNPGREYAPFEFPLGQGRVIKGWDEGFKHLSIGSKATLYIPSPMAYGPSRMNDVLVENSILVFDVELLDIN